MRIVNLAVDSGKYATKLALANNGVIIHQSIRTKMDEGVSKMDFSKQSSTYEVEFEGERYLLGEQAETMSADTKKDQPMHKIATYVMIALNTGNGDHVNLAIGCPLSVYGNKTARNLYKEYIAKNNTTVNIRVDGRPRMFVIDKVYVYPESSGIIYLNSSKYANKTVGVIDIGGLNANCCIYKQLVPQPTETMFTAKSGGNMLTQNIIKTLESVCNGGDQIGEYMYDQIMQDGVLEGHPESADIIKEKKLEHVKHLFEDCQHHKWSPNVTPIVFTGGTSKCLKDEIATVFKLADLDNLDNEAEYKNVDGFLMQMLDTLGVGY
nr:ParM/StbA family protein [uncultured Butyrivibrio sp.]